MKEAENQELKNIMQKIKAIYKNGSKIIKLDDTEIEEQEFHQYKKPYFDKRYMY